MEVSNPRDDRAERNRGSAEVPLSTVIPRVGNFHLEKNTILDSFSCTTTPQIWFISRFCVIFGALSLGENTWVRCNFITQAKSVAISVWCARNPHIPHLYKVELGCTQVCHFSLFLIQNMDCAYLLEPWVLTYTIINVLSINIKNIKIFRFLQQKKISLYCMGVSFRNVLLKSICNL